MELAGPDAGVQLPDVRVRCDQTCYWTVITPVMAKP